MLFYSSPLLSSISNFPFIYTIFSPFLLLLPFLHHFFIFYYFFPFCNFIPPTLVSYPFSVGLLGPISTRFSSVNNFRCWCKLPVCLRYKQRRRLPQTQPNTSTYKPFISLPNTKSHTHSHTHSHTITHTEDTVLYEGESARGSRISTFIMYTLHQFWPQTVISSLTWVEKCTFYLINFLPDAERYAN